MCKCVNVCKLLCVVRCRRVPPLPCHRAHNNRQMLVSYNIATSKMFFALEISYLASLKPFLAIKKTTQCALLSLGGGSWLMEEEEEEGCKERRPCCLGAVVVEGRYTCEAVPTHPRHNDLHIMFMPRLKIYAESRNVLISLPRKDFAFGNLVPVVSSEV